MMHRSSAAAASCAPRSWWPWGDAHGGLRDAVEDDVRPERGAFVDYILAAFHPAWSGLAWLNINTLRAWTAIFIAELVEEPYRSSRFLLLAGLQGDTERRLRGG